MIDSLVRRLERYCFTPKDALTLGVCRLLFFGLLFWNYAGQQFAPWADVSPAFWQPIWVFQKFPIPVLSADALLVAEIVWKGSLALACVGLLTRWSTAGALGLGFYLLGLRHNWGKVSHDDASTVFILLILAISRCGDAVSLDALLRRRRRSGTDDLPASLPPDSGEYRWPIRAVWLVLSMVFFNSAVAKLSRSGLEWALSDNLSVLMVRLNYFNKPTTDWGLQLANLPGFGQFMGVSAILVELLFPLVLFSQIARWILVPSAFVMQIGNKVLLGVDFTGFMFAYVFFIDWRRMMSGMKRIRSAATTSKDAAVNEPAPRERRLQVHRVAPPSASSL